MPLTSLPHSTDQAHEQLDTNSFYTAFLKAYPSYTRTAILDDLRAGEYARLDAQDQVYLDYTGGGLYAESQIRQHMALLSDNVFGNPHSHNPTSQAMTDAVERGAQLCPPVLQCLAR